jgi:hypothetical protein
MTTIALPMATRPQMDDEVIRMQEAHARLMSMRKPALLDNEDERMCAAERLYDAWMNASSPEDYPIDAMLEGSGLTREWLEEQDRLDSEEAALAYRAFIESGDEEGIPWEEVRAEMNARHGL